MNKHEKAALDDLLQWRNETRRLDDVIGSQQERIAKLEQIANEAIEIIEDMAGGPCYPSIECRKRLEQLQ